MPRAENFGYLITADHKVLSENCESRNNHRYAIVVQDLATQWIQSHPCKTKTSQEHVEEFFLSVGPSSSAEVRMVVVNEIKEVEGEKQLEVQED